MTYQYVSDDALRIIAAYEDLFVNTGGNPAAELLEDLQRPSTDERPNNLLAVNEVRFMLAISVQSQVSLLLRLEREGFIQKIGD